MDIGEVDDIQRAVAGGRVGHQRRQELLLHLWGSGPLREGLPQGKGKGQVRQRLRQRSRARVSTRVKARAPGGTSAITAARWNTSVPSAGSIGRTIRTRFASWTSRRRRLSNRWSVRRVGWWVRWTKLYTLQRLLGPGQGRWHFALIVAEKRSSRTRTPFS